MIGPKASHCKNLTQLLRSARICLSQFFDLDQRSAVKGAICLNLYEEILDNLHARSSEFWGAPLSTCVRHALDHTAHSKGITMNCTTRLALFAAVLLVAGCNARTDPKHAAPAAGSSADPYDASKMDFKPGLAQVTSERHSGPFSAGTALSLDATVKPLVSDPVKEIRLDTTTR
jgi:hypothetical protein